MRVFGKGACKFAYSSYFLIEHKAQWLVWVTISLFGSFLTRKHSIYLNFETQLWKYRHLLGKKSGPKWWHLLKILAFCFKNDWSIIFLPTNSEALVCKPQLLSISFSDANQRFVRLILMAWSRAQKCFTINRVSFGVFKIVSFFSVLTSTFVVITSDQVF